MKPFRQFLNDFTQTAIQEAAFRVGDEVEGLNNSNVLRIVSIEQGNILSPIIYKTIDSDGIESLIPQKRLENKIGNTMKTFAEFLEGSTQVTEALIDKLEKFAGEKIKPGRVTIKGYPVDVTDSDGSYIEMDAVDRDAATGLVKALRKDGFKAKRVGDLGILIEEYLTKDFSLNEVSQPTEFLRLKSLVFYIEQAIQAKNKEAYNELMKAVMNFGDSITMNKHTQAASKLMKFKPYR